MANALAAKNLALSLFSSAGGMDIIGKQEGIDDPRGLLAFQMVRFASATTYRNHHGTGSSIS